MNHPDNKALKIRTENKVLQKANAIEMKVIQILLIL